MRQLVSDDYTLGDASRNPIVFKNNLGHNISLYVIDSHVIRVTHTLHSSEQQTLSNTQHTLSTTNYTVTHQTQKSNTTSEPSKTTITLTTDDIQVSITPSPFCITWKKAPSSPSSSFCVTADEQGDTNEDWFAQDLANRSYCYDRTHGTRWHYQRRRSGGDFYYGLGERSGRLNLGGRRFRLERMDAMGYDAETQDPLYKFCPFYVGLTSSSSSLTQVYGVYYNNFGRTLLDFGQERDAMWGDYSYYQVEHGPLDYYMIYGGASVGKVVQTFNTMMGGHFLMPRSMFGYLASGMGYAEQDNAQQQLEQFVDNCRQQYKIPCDGMHLSSGYTVNPGSSDDDDNNSSSDGDRWVFTWNNRRFPDPKRLAQVYRDSGMKIFANVKPWLLTSHPDYFSLESHSAFVWEPGQNGARGKPATIWQWRGGENTKGQASYIDFTSSSGYCYWKKRLTTFLLDLGYDIWLDNNEFTMVDDETQTFQCQRNCDDYPKTSSRIGIPYTPHTYVAHSPHQAIKVGTPTQTLLMIQASYEAIRECRPDERSCLITRSTVPFCQSAVAQTWSGDNYTAWKTLSYNISMGTGANLCGMPGGYGHDLGGFSGPAPSPEQLVRWIQQGVFWTRFCIHSWNSDKSITEPWMYPDVLPIIRSSIEWRYKWIPYLYSLYAILTFRNNQPVIRPTFYDHPNDKRTFTQDFEFMVGSQLLVAPVYEEGKTTRLVYLPLDNNNINNDTTTSKGAVSNKEQSIGWYHYQTGHYYLGGQEVTVAAPLTDATSPLFVKAGSFMCYGKLMPHVHALPDDERRIHIYPPPATEATIAYKDKDQEEKPHRWIFNLYEDDGRTMAYQQYNGYTDIVLWMECYIDRLLVGIDITFDGYFPDYDTLWVTCPLDSEKRPLLFDGEEMESFNRYDVEDELVYNYLGIEMPWAKPVSDGVVV
ncbi:glycosyl hydrolases family 31-domain-containing protein [Chlamydoabsidia padenii]|nr:glycosyl hydrolases family 31-domain-containing protein [Chlamydoabsidia padenii]